MTAQPTLPEPWPSTELSDAEFCALLHHAAEVNERNHAHSAASLYREAARRISNSATQQLSNSATQ